MANFSIDLASHRLHAFLQRKRYAGLALIVIAGAIIGAGTIAMATYQVVRHISPEREAALLRLEHTKSTIAKLRDERTAQAQALANLEKAPQVAQQTSLSNGGFTEDDVNYWRKQMAAFGQMTGVQLDIVGRGPSRYRNATKLNITVSLSGAGAQAGLSSVDVIKALDFLQLYGYVESFNGTEATVHISENT
jgi:hypothetical protein